MGKRWLFQGDSITDCCRVRDVENVANNNLALGSGYPDLFASRVLYDNPRAGWEFFNRGISGNRVVDLLARWKRDTLNLQPDYLSILVGVNDTWHEAENRNGVSIQHYEAVYRMLIQWTLEQFPAIKIALLEPYVLNFGVVAEWDEKFPREVPERAKIVRAIAADYHLTFVPLQEKLTAAAKIYGEDKVLRDGVHPFPVGHQLIADAPLEATKEWR